MTMSSSGPPPAGAGSAPAADPRLRGRTISYPSVGWLLAAYRRRGPVFSFGPYVYLLGPEANRYVFANSDRFRWREAFDSLVPVDGETALLVSDGADHRRRRRLVQPALHHRQVRGYLEIIADNVDAMLDQWQPGTSVDVYQELRAAIRRSTIQALFGRRMADDASFFGDQLQVLLDLVDTLPQIVDWHRRLRTPRWRRAMAARDRVDERVYAEIARVRDGVVDADDNVLVSLVRGRTEEGDGLTDLEVRDQVVSLIAAGYETTGAAAAWAVYALLSTPGAWARARAEVFDVLGTGGPTVAGLGELHYLNGVVQETLRLYPPAVVSVRHAIADLEFGGRRVRAGRPVLYSPYVTHRLAEVWPDPLAFRPERWDTGHTDYRKPELGDFVPFGGGPHRCIGATFATTELTVLLARLVTRWSPYLPDQRIRPTSFAAMRPRDGLRLVVG